MSLTEKLQLTVDDLAILEDPQERLGAVVDRAKRIPPLPTSERLEETRVRGCVSVVWLVGEIRDGRCHFRADAESPLVRGLMIFLCEFFSGAPSDEIAATPLDPLAALDLTRNLSPTRRHGLASALATIRAFATTHSS